MGALLDTSHSFRFGIEHELAFVDNRGQLAAWTSEAGGCFARIIAALPRYTEDDATLHIGDAGIRVKRWYIEGLERFDDTGRLVALVPKGIEIRTTPHPTIAGACDELAASFARLYSLAAAEGLRPLLTSIHPYATQFVYEPPLSRYERALHAEEPDLQTEVLAMLTYGPDLNLSSPALRGALAIDAGQKLTYYSPFIVPFSFSSPFFAGRQWHGFSARTFLRTGRRPAARVFVAQPAELVPREPALTRLARKPAEVGRIEFKACDSCADFRLYAALLALLKGLLLDTGLPGRAWLPDQATHQHAAQQGFDNPIIVAGAAQVLAAAAGALGDDPDSRLLAPLYQLLERRETPAHALIRRFQQTGALIDTLHEPYAWAEAGG